MTIVAVSRRPQVRLVLRGVLEVKIKRPVPLWISPHLNAQDGHVLGEITIATYADGEDTGIVFIAVGTRMKPPLLETREDITGVAGQFRYVLLGIDSLTDSGISKAQQSRDRKDRL